MREKVFKVYTLGELIDKLGAGQIAVSLVKSGGFLVGERLHIHSGKLAYYNNDSYIQVPSAEYAGQTRWLILTKDVANA